MHFVLIHSHSLYVILESAGWSESIIGNQCTRHSKYPASRSNGSALNVF